MSSRKSLKVLSEKSEAPQKVAKKVAKKAKRRFQRERNEPEQVFYTDLSTEEKKKVKKYYSDLNTEVRRDTPIPNSVYKTVVLGQKSKIFDIGAALKDVVKFTNVRSVKVIEEEKKEEFKLDEGIKREFLRYVKEYRDSSYEIEFRFGTAGSGSYEPNKNETFFKNLLYQLDNIQDSISGVGVEEQLLNVFEKEEYPLTTTYLGELRRKGGPVKNFRGRKLEGSEITWEEKTKISSIQSDIWGLSLVASRERTHGPDSSIKVTGTRNIKRTSYTCLIQPHFARAFRIDLSEVEYTAIGSEKSSQSYEIEVEVVREVFMDKYFDKKKRVFDEDKIRKDVSSLVELIEKGMCVMPMSLQETKSAVSTINNFVYTAFGSKKTASRSGIADGFENKPVNITPENFIFSNKPWYLTKKSDGTRVMLLVTKDGIYQINPPYDIEKLSSGVRDTKITPALLEAEMTNHRQTFEVFDCLIMGGYSLHKEKFSSRMAKFFEAKKAISAAMKLSDLKLVGKKFMPTSGLEPVWVDYEKDEGFREEFDATYKGALPSTDADFEVRIEELIRRKSISGFDKESFTNMSMKEKYLALLQTVRGEIDHVPTADDEIEAVAKAYIYETVKTSTPTQAILRKKYVELMQIGTFEDVFSDLREEIEGSDEYDGIMFQPDTPYASGYHPELNETFKWKPMSKLSIDFKPRIIKETPKSFTVELMCGKNTLFLGNEEDSYKGSSHIKKSDLGEREIEAIKKGMVCEFLWDQDDKVFKFYRLRPDKKFPNSERVARSVWNEIMNPFVPGTDFSKGSKLVRLFHNKVKKDLLGKWSGGAKELVDFGTGQGGDINKWVELGFEKVLAVDPDPPGKIKSSHEELMRRIEGVKKKISIKVLRAGGEETERVVDALQKHEIIPGVATAFFCLTFFDDENLDLFVDTINSAIPDGGYFIGTVLDGNEVEALLNGETSYESSILKIQKKGKDKVRVAIKDSRVDQVENLFYFEPMRHKLEENYFELLSTGLLDQHYDSLIYEKLSESEKQYSKLNRYFVFKKGVKEIFNSAQKASVSYMHRISNDALNIASIESVLPRMSFLSAVIYAIDKKYKGVVDSLRVARDSLVVAKKSDIPKLKKTVASLHVEAITRLKESITSITNDDSLGDIFSQGKYGKAKINGYYLQGMDYDDAKDFAIAEYTNLLEGNKTKKVDYSMTEVSHRSLLEVLSEFLEYNIIIMDANGNPYSDYVCKYKTDRKTIAIFAYSEGESRNYAPLKYKEDYVIPNKTDFVQSVCFGQVIEGLKVVKAEKKVSKGKEKIEIEEDEDPFDAEDAFDEETPFDEEGDEGDEEDYE